MVHAHANVQPPRVRERAPDIDIGPRFEDLIARLLAKEPVDRPAAPQEVLRELEVIDHGRAVALSRQPRQFQWTTRAIVLCFTVATVLVLGVAAATFEGRLALRAMPGRTTEAVLSDVPAAKQTEHGSAPGFRSKSIVGQGKTSSEQNAKVDAKPDPRHLRHKVRVIKYDWVKIKPNAVNREAKRRVLRAARRCYQEAYPNASPRVDFTLTVFSAAPLEVVARGAPEFEDCLKTAAESVQHDVTRDGFIAVGIIRNGLASRASGR